METAGRHPSPGKLKQCICHWFIGLPPLLPPSPHPTPPHPTQGNVKFASADDDSLSITNTSLVHIIAELLGTSANTLEKALCYRVVGNKLGSVDKMHTEEQALYGRNAFTKVGVTVGCGQVVTMNRISVCSLS